VSEGTNVGITTSGIEIEVSPHPTVGDSGQHYDPLDNKPWIKLVEEGVDLFDELDSHQEGLDPAGREIAEHVCLRLREILERCDVEVIDEDRPFDRTLH
jgi:hypothetical protein